MPQRCRAELTDGSAGARTSRCSRWLSCLIETTYRSKDYGGIRPHTAPGHDAWRDVERGIIPPLHPQIRTALTVAPNVVGVRRSVRPCVDRPRSLRSSAPSLLPSARAVFERERRRAMEMWDISATRLEDFYAGRQVRRQSLQIDFCHCSRRSCFWCRSRSAHYSRSNVR